MYVCHVRVEFSSIAADVSIMLPAALPLANRRFEGSANCVSSILCFTLYDVYAVASGREEQYCQSWETYLRIPALD